jgi:DNA-binding response OmpR family regulator
MWEVAVSRHVPEVVVVDDDRGVREALLRGLSLEGILVREAADGALALAEIEPWLIAS